MWRGREFQSAVAVGIKEDCIAVVPEKRIMPFDVW